MRKNSDSTLRTLSNLNEGIHFLVGNKGVSIFYFYKVTLTLSRQPPKKGPQFTQRPVFHPVRAQLLNQLGEAAHWSASSSATIASMEARSSR